MRKMVRAVIWAAVVMAAGGAAATAQDLKVRVLDPGAEPRAKLAYAPEKNSVQFSRLTMNNSITTESGGAPAVTTKYPLIVMEMVSRVTERRSTGVFTVEGTMHKATVKAGAGVDEMLVAQVSRGYREMEGSKTTAGWTARGEKVEAGSGANPMSSGMGGSGNSLAVVLPAEAVGAGAKWEFESVVVNQGFSLNVRQSFELLEVSGSRIKVRTRLEGSAPRQEVTLPQLPAGARAEVLAATLTGSSVTEVDLSKSNPVRSEQKLLSDTRIKVTGTSPESQNLTERADMRVLIEEIEALSPRDPAPPPPPRPAAPK